jgi:hypothetical protein
LKIENAKEYIGSCKVEKGRMGIKGAKRALKRA